MLTRVYHLLRFSFVRKGLVSPLCDSGHWWATQGVKHVPDLGNQHNNGLRQDQTFDNLGWCLSYLHRAEVAHEFAAELHLKIGCLNCTTGQGTNWLSSLLFLSYLYTAESVTDLQKWNTTFQVLLPKAKQTLWAEVSAGIHPVKAHFFPPFLCNISLQFML